MSVIPLRNLLDYINPRFPTKDGSAFIAMGVILDNDMVDGMTSIDWFRFKELAGLISAEMANSDEPRFSLYDYLDAAVNHVDGDWKKLRGMFLKEPETAFRKIVAMAEDKRRTYES